MAEKTPVRVNYDGSGNPVGFAELQSADFIGLDDGGTGGAYASIAALLTGLGIGTGDSPVFTGLTCLLYTSPSPRDATLSRMPSSA